MLTNHNEEIANRDLICHRFSQMTTRRGKNDRFPHGDSANVLLLNVEHVGTVLLTKTAALTKDQF